MSRTTASHFARSTALALALCASLAGCGGSSNEPPATPPSLSNFTYTPSSAALSSGGGTVVVNWDADVADSGADITQLVIKASNTANPSPSTVTLPVQNPAGVTVAHFSGTITFSTAAATTFTFTIQVVDGRGTGSNVLQGTLSVL